MPVLVNVYDHESPLFRVPESNFTGALVVVTVCGTLSWLVHWTVWPTWTTSCFPLPNLLPMMSTW
ncbi:hypothetical protein SALBM311S_01041 [Streptomyces alboniger]